MFARRAVRRGSVFPFPLTLSGALATEKGTHFFFNLFHFSYPSKAFVLIFNTYFLTLTFQGDPSILSRVIRVVDFDLTLFFRAQSHMFAYHAPEQYFPAKSFGNKFVTINQKPASFLRTLVHAGYRFQ